MTDADSSGERRLQDERAARLAALKAAGVSMTDPGSFATTNLSGTINVLNALVQHGVPRLVFSSSAAVYGEPKRVPMDETHPTEPENFYGYTKLEIEGLMAWYDRLKGLRFTALRYFNAAGYDVNGRITGLEKGVTNLVPVLMEVAAGLRDGVQVFGTDYDTPDGSCIRDYIHVNDLATAHVQSMDHMVTTDASHVFNVGTGSGASVLEMLATTRRVTGREVPATMVDRRPGDPSMVYASSEKIHAAFGWAPQHSAMSTILESTWKAYQTHHG